MPNYINTLDFEELFLSALIKLNGKSCSIGARHKNRRLQQVLLFLCKFYICMCSLFLTYLMIIEVIQFYFKLNFFNNSLNNKTHLSVSEPSRLYCVLLALIWNKLLTNSNVKKNHYLSWHWISLYNLLEQNPWCLWIKKKKKKRGIKLTIAAVIQKHSPVIFHLGTLAFQKITCHRGSFRVILYKGKHRMLGKKPRPFWLPWASVDFH